MCGHFRREVEMRYEAPKARPRPDGCLTVAVKKLPENAMEDDVRKLFKGIDSISDVRALFRLREPLFGRMDPVFF